MQKWQMRFFALLTGLFIALFPVFSEQTEIPGLFKYKLENGLEVFVFENHAVPLARIQITFRCGSISQTPETAGLFHFYEHMLFKGNTAYPTKTEFKSALTRLGVATWNGGTSTEYVTYFFTVPSTKVKEGIEFWSHAVISPLFDEQELEVEKGVVINEIKGYFNEPDNIFESALDTRMFSTYPERRDVSGTETAIRSATRDTMLSIKNAYYIPNNAAIFIGGDVSPEETYAAVREFFGGWERGKDPWKDGLTPHPDLKENPRLVYADPAMYQGISTVSMRFRGPDVTADPYATFAADVWGTLIGSPTGRFKNSVFEKVPGLYEKEYISGYYYTQRDGGVILFDTFLFSEGNAADTALQFTEAVQEEMRAMAEEKDYFSEEEFEIVKQKLIDQQIYIMESPESFIQNLSFFWAVADTDYFFSYIPTMRSMKSDDLSAFLNRYINSRNFITAVRMNKADYEKQASTFKDRGFEEITKANAYWWAK